MKKVEDFAWIQWPNDLGVVGSNPNQANMHVIPMDRYLTSLVQFDPRCGWEAVRECHNLNADTLSAT